MVAKFAGKCWICRTKQATCVDHDHATGAVRGALCSSCNTKLGQVDNADWMTQAREYLEAAARCG